MSDATATVGNGRFTLQAMLGEGGMARVYRAYDHRLRRWRAIKMLLPEFATKASIRKRFEAEAQALALLEHPNIVRIYDVGGHASESYIVMELCEGGAVDDWLVEHGRMPARLAVDVVLAACAGMQAAHDAGIIHRDLKPGNLLVDRRGRVKVTDFGIARTEMNRSTRTNSAMGTYGYMAPEQNANAKGVDVRTDVYAMGATLFTLVTGNTEPHLFTIDREPERLEPVPAPLRDIVATAVAFSPDDRFADIATLEAALASVRAHLPEVDAGTPPLVWRRVPELEPPPEPLNRESLAPSPAPEVVSAPASARETVPDTFLGSEPPSSGLVEFELPNHAPDPFLAMTPGGVERRGNATTESSASRRRFDQLYVTEDEPKPEDDRFVDTMVGWKPRERSELDRAVRDGSLPEEPLARPGVADMVMGLANLRTVGMALVTIVLLVGLLALAWFGSAWAGGEAVEAHRAAYWRATAEYLSAMDADPTLAQDLIRDGGNAQTLTEALATYRRATTVDARREAAEVLTAQISAEFAVMRLQDRLSDQREAALADRVEAILKQRRLADTAMGNWQTASGTFGGDLAVRLGTATAPEHP